MCVISFPIWAVTSNILSVWYVISLILLLYLLLITILLPSELSLLYFLVVHQYIILDVYYLFTFFLNFEESTYINFVFAFLMFHVTSLVTFFLILVSLLIARVFDFRSSSEAWFLILWATFAFYHGEAANIPYEHFSFSISVVEKLKKEY